MKLYIFNMFPDTDTPLTDENHLKGLGVHVMMAKLVCRQAFLYIQ